jgi:beta-phosphoglucomutase-like phosphatase (HAD superfamily)
VKIEGILWDNDGVLVDTERLFYQSNRELFLPFGVDLSELDFFNWYLADNCGAWHLLAHLGIRNCCWGLPSSPSRASASYCRRWRHGCRWAW